MSNVAFIRPEQARLLPLYEVIRDCIAGEVTVKLAGTKYLPMPNASDKSEENKAHYQFYKNRAVFYNVARRTLLSLIGQIFNKDPVVKLPKLLDPLIADVTGSGISLNQLAERASSYALAYSRCGIFTDFVANEGGVSAEDIQSGKARPTIHLYSPFNIPNWRTRAIGSEEVLSLVVLYQPYIFADDGFEIKQAGEFRVLRLDEQGFYVHEVWREEQPTEYKENKYPTHLNFRAYQVFRPTDENGNRLDRIPFWFIGSENNDAMPDNPNYYDMCSLNLAHYRNSADYEEASYVLQPTVVVSGLTEEWLKTQLGGKVQMGATGGIPLPANADAKIIQGEPNNMVKEAMDTKERQMVAIGAKLVEQKSVQRTATEASLDTASNNSTLGNVARNVSQAFTNALKLSAKFIKAGESEIEFTLNQDFDVARMSAEERRQIVSEWQTGAITFDEMRTGLKRAGIATEDDAGALAKIQASKDLEAERQIKIAQSSKNVGFQNN